MQWASICHILGDFGVIRAQNSTFQGADALFLLDDGAASFITGVVLPIDGGFSAYSGV